ncbi:MAG TPA: NAD(P)-dependent alcohol dehydrogenase [Terriglobia bacterium]|nr:NAD(P)-dependent alcohol dehydrogenase [Terriglobia bacterium]
MKVYLVTKGSTGFDGLRRTERDRPVPSANQVLVRMRAASLNFRDLAIVNGKYIGGPVLSDTIPLSDGAGDVASVGTAVREFAVGDRVVATFAQGDPPAALGSPLDGVLAEYALFDPKGLLRVPDHLSYAEAATLPCAGVTAWNALFHGRQLRPGETVLTLGTGGVSVFTLQLAKLAGARVIITSSSDAKLTRAQALGADHIINYKLEPNWEKRVLEMTNGLGADKVVDLAGVGTLPHSYQAVGPGGEVLVIGVLSRPEGDLSPYPLMMKGATLRGIFVGGREHFQGLIKAVAANRFKPVIDKTFDFDSSPDAYAYLKSAQHFGKVVITI